MILNFRLPKWKINLQVAENTATCRPFLRVDEGGALCFGKAPSGLHVDVHAKSRRAPSSGLRVVVILELWSPGRSPVDWKESRKENLLVDDEGKLHLRCAERDAKCASSVLVWKLVISSG